jgi:riboflavin synthase
MFTGLIQAIGAIETARPRGGALALRVAADLGDGLADGESICISGVCLTVEQADAHGFSCYAGTETLARTTLREVHPGRRVNLERSLRPMDRLGGHFVLGHVDGTGRLTGRRSEGETLRLEFWAPEGITELSVEKGSIAVEGVSLTIVDLAREGFSVAAVPETCARTTLGELPVGAEVNLEADILAKYVQRLVAPARDGQGITLAQLRELGY